MKNSENRKIMVHKSMRYQCEKCGNVYTMYLEKGLEDKAHDLIYPEKHKPVPFTISCPCEKGALAKHVAWNWDTDFQYRELRENENYFENREDCKCGIPHIRNNGLFEIVDKMVLFGAEVEALEPVGMCRQEKPDENDDPYGLAHISTSILKSELRRRKGENQWSRQAQRKKRFN